MPHPCLSFQSPRTLIQVGAHAGDDRLIQVCRRHGHRLILFEPIPKWADILRQKAEGAPTIEVVAAAVSNYDGTARFRIAAHDDCSSLQEFAPDAGQTWVHPYHPYRRFETVEEIEVPVTRLDTFLNQRGIGLVNRLEIDAQGEDLRVVESLGERLASVDEIQIEVNIHSAPLYRNACTLAQAEAFMAAHHFRRHVAWRQSINREMNVVFRNRRFHPYPEMNLAAGALDQAAVSVYYASKKLPTVWAVTKMKMRNKFRRPQPEQAQA